MGKIFGKAVAWVGSKLLTERVIKKVVVELGDYLVNSTKNDLDNRIWNEVKKALDEK